METGQDETRLSCLVANCVHIADAEETRLVGVGVVNNLLVCRVAQSCCQCCALATPVTLILTVTEIAKL